MKNEKAGMKNNQAVFKCSYQQFDSCGLHCPKFQLGDPNRCLAKEVGDK